MGHVAIDDFISPKQIAGDDQLAGYIHNLEAGERTLLLVDGFPGVWVKTVDHGNGYSAIGIKPTGQARERWLQLQASRKTVVSIERPATVR